MQNNFTSIVSYINLMQLIISCNYFDIRKLYNSFLVLRISNFCIILKKYVIRAKMNEKKFQSLIKKHLKCIM